MATYNDILISLLKFRKNQIMENLDLIILTILVSLSFFGLGYSIFKTEKKVRENNM